MHSVEQPESPAQSEPPNPLLSITERELRSWSQIEDAIGESGLSAAKVLRHANLSDHTLWRGKQRGTRPRRDTRVRLATALRTLVRRAIEDRARS